MKYRDLITIFVIIILFLSIGFTLGVEISYWPLPIGVFAFLILIYYKLWK